MEAIKEADPLNAQTEPTRNMVISAKTMINALTTNFSPQNFENLPLQKMYSHLQALALGETEPEPVMDTLQVDQEGLEHVKPTILAFRHMIWEGDYVDPELRGKREEAKENKEGRGLGKGKGAKNVKTAQSDMDNGEDAVPAASAAKKKTKAKAKATDISDGDSSFEKPAKKEAKKAPKKSAKKIEDKENSEDGYVPDKVFSQKATTKPKTRGNRMDAEKPKQTIIEEEDDIQEEEVIKKKTKGSKH